MVSTSTAFGAARMPPSQARKRAKAPAASARAAGRARALAAARVMPSWLAQVSSIMLHELNSSTYVSLSHSSCAHGPATA
jgi:hypothetical protein